MTYMTPNEYERLAELQDKLEARFKDLLKSGLMGGFPSVAVSDVRIKSRRKYSGHNDDYQTVRYVEATFEFGTDEGWVQIPFSMTIEDFHALGVDQKLPTKLAIEKKLESLDEITCE